MVSQSPKGSSQAASTWDKFKANESLHLAWCVCGVVGCLMLYGVLQERIMVEPFGEGEAAEKFGYSLFLVLCNRLTSCSIAIFCLLSAGKTSEIKPVAPWYNYAMVSVSNVVATFCQYEALKYVSFPVQTLGKCAKMMPVMIWGIIIMRKRYTVKDFALAVAVTGGCTLFLLTGEVKSKAAKAEIGGYYALYGLALMLGYLGFDGFTSTFQDKLFKGYQMTTYNQILWTTIFSSLFSVFSMRAAGQDVKAVEFVMRHPDALWSIVTLSAAASIGALFISYTIKSFGALVFATIMTTRQFLSILLSCFLFLHPLSQGQWAGTVIVFGALYYQGFSKKDKHSKEGDRPSKATAAPSSLDEESQTLLKAPLEPGAQSDSPLSSTTTADTRSVGGAGNADGAARPRHITNA